ncbi:hypothetical protein FVE85_3309 [Porphyridium purpureum]|uniref:Uncharacterized protein n=1 Tax=Porphyridium purpureum TaxID=35688 RepID=A0A5J4YV51_PORPP|nr:hypothetical protein FVE85_3309 [Porphyridium purpureum]|eukprot:POR2866..scf227_4
MLRALTLRGALERLRPALSGMYARAVASSPSRLEGVSEAEFGEWDLDALDDGTAGGKGQGKVPKSKLVPEFGAYFVDEDDWGIPPIHKRKPTQREKPNLRDGDKAKAMPDHGATDAAWKHDLWDAEKESESKSMSWGERLDDADDAKRRRSRIPRNKMKKWCKQHGLTFRTWTTMRPQRLHAKPWICITYCKSKDPPRSWECKASNKSKLGSVDDSINKLYKFLLRDKKRFRVWDHVDIDQPLFPRAKGPKADALAKASQSWTLADIQQANNPKKGTPSAPPKPPQVERIMLDADAMSDNPDDEQQSAHANQNAKPDTLW